MPKPQGRCIFCNETGLTKEHVFSDWVNDVLPDKGSANTSNFVGYRSTVSTDTPIIEEIKRRQGGPGTLKARVVCKSCNNGWMGKLQERAKPILERLVLGESLVIDQTAQSLIAGWIAMATITGQFLRCPPDTSIPSEEGQYFWKNQTPPEEWQIWMAPYEGSVRNISYSEARAGLSLSSNPFYREEFKRVNTQTTSLVIGKLYFYVFSTTVKGVTPIVFRGQMSDRMCPLWPLMGRDIDWPHGPGIGDLEVTALARALPSRLGIRIHV